MTVEELRKEIATLPGAEQDQLMAYLVHLRHQRDPEILREITRQLDQAGEEAWASLAELKERWK